MRKEKKYIIKNNDINSIILLSKELGTLDEFSDNSASYKIDSFYRLIWQAKDVSGKIRIRKYISNEKETYFLENKYKEGGKSFKKRIEIDKSLSVELLQQSDINSLISCIANIDPQILFFMDFYIDFQMKIESIMLSYKRKAFILNMDHLEYRITIDFDLSINYENKNFPLLSEKECILEIKGVKLRKIINLYHINEIASRSKLSKYKRAMIFINSKVRLQDEL